MKWAGLCNKQVKIYWQAKKAKKKILMRTKSKKNECHSKQNKNYKNATNYNTQLVPVHSYKSIIYISELFLFIVLRLHTFNNTSIIPTKEWEKKRVIEIFFFWQKKRDRIFFIFLLSSFLFSFAWLKQSYNFI